MVRNSPHASSTSCAASLPVAQTVDAAHDLGISETTVKTHVNSLLGKLGVADRTHAATVAIQRGNRAPQMISNRVAARSMRVDSRHARADSVLRCHGSKPRDATPPMQPGTSPTDDELMQALPARAPVQKERIEDGDENSVRHSGRRRPPHRWSCVDHRRLLCGREVFALFCCRQPDPFRRNDTANRQICHRLESASRTVWMSTFSTPPPAMIAALQQRAKCRQAHGLSPSVLFRRVNTLFCRLVDSAYPMRYRERMYTCSTASPLPVSELHD